jgi:hypothetical protein
MDERELQDAHARILDLEQQLADEKAAHLTTLGHSRRWERRAKDATKTLNRIRNTLEGHHD